jgi:hypothetical protein
VKSSLGLVDEDTSGLADVVSASLSPLNVAGVLLVKDVNKVSINFYSTFSLFNSALEAT